MIIRRRYNANYCVIPNKIMDDKELSAEGLGVLCYLLSRPPNWSVYAEQLKDRFGCGRERMYRILNEIIDLGYIRRERLRCATSKKFTEYEYIVYDDPQAIDIIRVD